MEHLYITTIILKGTLSAEELKVARESIISRYANQNGTIQDSGDGKHLLRFASDDEDGYGCMAWANLEIGEDRDLVSTYLDSWFIEYEDEPWENTDLLLEVAGRESAVHFKEWENPCADMENLYETTIMLKDTLSSEQLADARKQILEQYSNQNGTIQDSGDGKHLLRFVADDEDGYGCMVWANLEIGENEYLVLSCIESWEMRYKDEPWENTDILSEAIEIGREKNGWR